MTARIRLAVRAAAVALAGGIAFAACAPGVLATDASIAAISTFSNIPTVTVKVQPDFEVDPKALDFGNVPVGSTKSLHVLVTNVGTDASNYVLAGGATRAGDVFVGSLDPACPSQMSVFPHGKTCGMIYIFKPTSQGPAEDTSGLEISYSESNSPLFFPLTMSGCGAGPNGAGCPTRPTPSATPSPTLQPSNKDGGTQSGPQAQPTGGGVAPVGGPPASDSPASNLSVVPAASGSGSGSLLLTVLVAAAAAAVVGTAFAALVLWRGRQIWEMLTSHRR
jgi:hypothetical protein